VIAMTKTSVSEYLERAREIAALADRKSGEEKKRLLQIAEAWLKLAEESAAEAVKSASIKGALPEHPKIPH
jgi:hypothetical protein